MKIYKKYKNSFLSFLSNKKYMSLILITVILSYGFWISHFSIGIDDLCLDRYVDGTYILSAGRWGTWLVYNLLNITTYIPFWVDVISIIILFITSTLICVFIKKITKNKLKEISYILFSMSFISFPVISCFLVYLPTKLSIVLSNLIITIIFIILYENIMNTLKLNKLHYLLIVLGLIFSISMYESCCQTFVVLSFMSLFLYDKYNKKLETKDIFRFLLKLFGILLISIIVNYLINQILFLILDYFGIFTKDYSFKMTLIDLIKHGYGIIEVVFYKLGAIVVDTACFNSIFLVLCIFTPIYVFIDSHKNYKSFFLYLCTILANFILLFILMQNLFRICYSWTITFAFILLYFSDRINKKYIIVLLFTIVLFNTKSMTQYFYEDYKVYQSDLVYTTQIINEIYSNVNDLNKPILFVPEQDDIRIYDFNKYVINRNSVYLWGMNAFDEKGTEIIKFFNHLGYNFDIVDNYEEAYSEYLKVNYLERKEKVLEMDDFIVVKISG